VLDVACPAQRRWGLGFVARRQSRLPICLCSTVNRHPTLDRLNAVTAN
jgi:hypothetical protein